MQEQESSHANDACIRALARVLAEAKAGKIRSVAIVQVDQAGEPTVIVGGLQTDAIPINFGCDLIKNGFMPKPVASPIFRPGH